MAALLGQLFNIGQDGLSVPAGILDQSAQFSQLHPFIRCDIGIHLFFDDGQHFLFQTG